MDELIYPRRLVMIQLYNNCMFCEKPSGVSYTMYVDFYNKLGYIYCINCELACKAAKTIWNEQVAFGPVNYLKDKLINVRRTTGEIESGWIIDSPLTSYNQDCKETIHCYHSEHDLGKWCLLEDIILLNPKL